MAQTIDELLVRIDATTEGLRRELRRADQGLNRFDRNVNSTLKKTESRFDRMGVAVQRAIGPMVAAFGAQALARDVLNTVTQFEKLDQRLLRLVGSTERFNEETEYLRKTADRMSVEIGSLTEQYTRLITLQNSGLITQQEARDLLEGFADVAAATGASSAQLGQVMFGLAQGLSAGTVRAEELNQVTEPLPGLLQALDESAGLAAGGFRRMVVDGEVTSRFFAETLVKALKTYSGAAEDMRDTVTAASTRMQNSWTQLKRELAEPIADVVSPFLDEITKRFQTTAKEARALIALIERIGDLPGIRSIVSMLGGDSLADVQRQLAGVNEQISEMEGQLIRGEVSGSMEGTFRAEFDRLLMERHRLLDRLRSMQGEEGGGGPNITITRGQKPTTPTKPTGGGAGTARRGLTEAEKEALAIQRVIEALSFEQAQLLRTGREQAQYNALKAAGIDASHASAPAIMAEAAAVYNLEQAGKQLDDLIADDKGGIFGTQIEKVAETTDKASVAMARFGDVMNSAFEDAILNGKDLGDVLGGLLQDIARLGLRSGLNGLFGSGGTFDIGSAVSSGIGSLFGGFFAEGGRPPVGRASIVGEKGPELFVPKTAGTIIPNHALGSSGSTINYSPTFQIDARNSTLSAGEIRAIVDASSQKAVTQIRNMQNRHGSARI